MGNVVWHVTMQLDGFITGPDDSMEWAFEYPGPNRIADEVIKSTGAVLAGRRCTTSPRPGTAAEAASTAARGRDPCSC